MFRLIDISIDMIFFSINWKNYFDRSILFIAMTVLVRAIKDPDNCFRGDSQALTLMLLSPLAARTMYGTIWALATL